MKFTLNNKIYETKEINFESIVILEGMGLNIMNIEKQIFTTISALVAYHCEMELSEACKEIEDHIIHGGKMDDLIPLMKDFAKSDFFQKMQ